MKVLLPASAVAGTTSAIVFKSEEQAKKKNFKIGSSIKTAPRVRSQVCTRNYTLGERAYTVPQAFGSDSQLDEVTKQKAREDLTKGLTPTVNCRYIN